MPFIFPYRNRTYIYDPKNNNAPLRVRTSDGLKEINVNHPSALSVLEHAYKLAAMTLRK